VEPKSQASKPKQQPTQEQFSSFPFLLQQIKLSAKPKYEICGVLFYPTRAHTI